MAQPQPVAIAMMPLPGSPGIPYFQGANATEFLSQWDYICGLYSKNKEEKRLALPHYCDPLIRDQVTGIPEYSANPYIEKDYYQAFKKLFREYDFDFIKYNREYLELLVRDGSKGAITPKEYLTSFHNIASNATKVGRSQDPLLTSDFMRGLQPYFKTKVAKRAGLDFHDQSTYDYEKAYAAAKKEIEDAENNNLWINGSSADVHRFRDLQPGYPPRPSDSLLVAAAPVPTIPTLPGQYRYGTVPHNYLGNQNPLWPFHTRQLHDPPLAATPPYIPPLQTTTHAPIQRDLPQAVAEATVPVTAAQPEKTSTSSDIEQITQSFKELSIAMAEMQKTQQQLAAQQNSVSQQSTSTNYPDNPTIRGGYQGSRGRGRGNRFGGYSDRTGNFAQGNALEIDAGGFDQGPREPKCWGCGNIGRDGLPVTTHYHTDRCEQMEELINLGCVHKMGFKYYLGPYDPRKESIELNFNRYAPLVNQILNKVRGTSLDPDWEKREMYREQERSSARDATNSRSLPFPSGGSHNNRVTQAQSSAEGNQYQILQRPQITPHVLGENRSVNGKHFYVDDSLGLDDCYEDRNDPEAMTVYAASGGRVVKPKSKAPSQTATSIMKLRAAAEEKLPKAKSQRSVALQPQLSTSRPQEPSEDTNMDKDEEDIEEIDRSETEVYRKTVRETGEPTKPLTKEQLDKTPPRKLRRNSTNTPLPAKTMKGIKEVWKCFEAPNPSAAVTNLWQAQNDHFSILLQMAGALSGKMDQTLQPVRLSQADAEKLVRTYDRMVAQDTVEREHIIQGNSAGTAIGLGRRYEDPLNLIFHGNQARTNAISFNHLIQSQSVVRSPRVLVEFIGNLKREPRLVMLDTGAEVNILPAEFARSLGCTIIEVVDFKLSSVSGQQIPFTGMCKLEVQIDGGFSCEASFFLIAEAPKILLGQPFIGKTRMNIDYKEDGSWDAIFTDPTNPKYRCQVMVVPPLRPQFRDTKKVHISPSVEEIVDEEFDSENE